MRGTPSGTGAGNSSSAERERRLERLRALIMAQGTGAARVLQSWIQQQQERARRRR